MSASTSADLITVSSSSALLSNHVQTKCRRSTFSVLSGSSDTSKFLFEVDTVLFFVVWVAASRYQRGGVEKNVDPGVGPKMIFGASSFRAPTHGITELPGNLWNEWPLKVSKTKCGQAQHGSQHTATYIWFADHAFMYSIMMWHEAMPGKWGRQDARSRTGDVRHARIVQRTRRAIFLVHCVQHEQVFLSNAFMMSLQSAPSQLTCMLPPL